MKFKYLSMALAAVALASCSSDDLKLADGTTMTLPDDGSKIFATINDPDAESITRAGFATQINYNEDGSQKSISQTAMFQEGDVFKMYCTHTWKPQTYKFVQDAEIDGVNGSLFEFADAESKLNDGGELSTREYGVFPANSFAFKDENRSKLYFTLAPVNVYESSSDGYYAPQSTNVTTSSGTDLSGRKVYKALVPMFGFNKENKIAFNYMTSLIRVQLQGVAEGVHNLVLSQTAKMAGCTNPFQLSGEFESTQFDATEGTDGKLPVFNRVETGVVGEQQINIQFATDGDYSDYIIYVPVPTGKYDLTKLKLTFDPASLTPLTGGTDMDLQVATGTYKGKKVSESTTAWDAAKVDFELGTGTKLLASLSQPEVAVATNLMKLNKILAKYADFGREAVVDVNIAGFTAIARQTDDTQVDANKKLYIPELKNDVTLNLTGADITSAEAAADQILYIVDKGTAGTGKLTINFSAKDDAAPRSCVKVVSTSAQNIELKTTNGATPANTATFAGATFDNAAAKVALNATFTAAPSIVKAAEITIGKDLGVGIDAGASNLIIKDHISGNVTVDGGNVTVEAEAVDVIPQIWVKKAATTKLDGADVLIKSGEVTNLVVNKAVTKVAMEGGKIGTLTGENSANTKFDDGTNLAIATAGAAEITTVNPANDPTKCTLTFTSTWNAATSASAAAGQSNIYTAAQLKAASAANATYDLQADITIAAGLTGADAFVSIAKHATTTKFNGNNHTITGLTAPLFGAITSAVAIKDLTLAGVAITSEDEANGVGAIAPSTNAAVTIEHCSVAGAISGHYYVGGLVGIVKGSTLTIGYQAANETAAEQTKMTNALVTAGVAFTNTKTYGTAIGWDDKAATWGKFVGSVEGTGELVIAENCTGTAAFDKKALRFSYNRTHNGSGTITGYYKGNTDLVGYTTTTGDITYGGKTYKNGWNTPVLVVTGDATLQTITAATILTTAPYQTLDDATKTAIKGVQAALTNTIDKINWSGLTIVSHNQYVATEY